MTNLLWLYDMITKHTRVYQKYACMCTHPPIGDLERKWHNSN
jgi:hypothetical protein